MTERDEIEELKRMEEVYTDPLNKEVEIEFVYPAPQAREVYLAGSFNNWDTKSLPMKKNKRGQWKATIKLLPGRYEYKYFADGSWVTNMQCAEVVADNTGSMNCIIDVAPKMAA
jgi:1,4-alpha-glucan branching enzyme